MKTFTIKYNTTDGKERSRQIVQNDIVTNVEDADHAFWSMQSLDHDVKEITSINLE